MSELAPTCVAGRAPNDIKESAGWDKSHAVGFYITGSVLSTISVVAGGCLMATRLS